MGSATVRSETHCKHTKDRCERAESHRNAIWIPEHALHNRLKRYQTTEYIVPYRSADPVYAFEIPARFMLGFRRRCDF